MDESHGSDYGHTPTPELLVLDNLNSPEGIESWLVNNTRFGDITYGLPNIPKVKLNRDHLILLYDNEQDPNIVSYINGMNREQLDYFRDFIPSNRGQEELAKLDKKWLEDAIRLGGYSNALDFAHRNIADFVTQSSRARAYFVLANRDKPEMFRDYSNELEVAAA